MTEYSSVLDILNIKKSTNPIFTVVNFINGKKHLVDFTNVIAFFKKYCDSLYLKDLKNWDVEPIFTLGETTTTSIPIMAEFEFKFDSENLQEEEALYSRDLVKEMVLVVQETMKEVFFFLPESQNWFVLC